MKPTKEMIEALKAAIEGECDGLAIDDQHANAVLDYVLSALSPAPVSEPEPVAWRDPKSFGDEDGFLRVRVSGPSGVETQPLFTSPPDLAAEIARLREALEQVKDAIMRADPEVLTDTLWMPEDVLMGATVVDAIDIALADQKGGAA